MDLCRLGEELTTLVMRTVGSALFQTEICLTCVVFLCVCLLLKEKAEVGEIPQQDAGFSLSDLLNAVTLYR